MNDEKYQLKITRNNDMVNITIGVELLTHAVLHGPVLGDNPNLNVTDKVKFVDNIINWLKYEDENGTTLIHQAFDQAALGVVESGCDGIDETKRKCKVIENMCEYYHHKVGYKGEDGYLHCFHPNNSGHCSDNCTHTLCPISGDASEEHS